MSLNYNNMWNPSTFKPLCCFSAEKLKKLVSFNDFHAQRSWDIFECQAAHLVGASVFQGRCSASVFWMVSHQLPEQLPKLHLIPIKPVSLPFPPGCMCNIKKLSDLFNTLADISAKVLGNCKWTLSPPKLYVCVCVHVCVVWGRKVLCVRVCVKDWSVMPFGSLITASLSKAVTVLLTQNRCNSLSHAPTLPSPHTWMSDEGFYN